MKHLSLLAFALLISTNFLSAQFANKEVTKLADQACTCFAAHNPVKDKQFDKIINKVYIMTPQAAENYIEKLPEDQRMRFAQNMTKIEKLDKTNSDFNQCITAWEDTAQAYLKEKEASGLTEEAILIQFGKAFKKKKKCRILALILLN